ncbi:MAG TPA: acyl-CoA thioesterase [Oculatellaceae cyanobacterium]
MSIGIAAIHTRLSSWSSDRDFLFLANQKEDHMNGLNEKNGLSQKVNKQFETRMVEMVFPNQTNHYGTLFGGQALQLMDKSAFMTASRYTRQAMVTACSERIDFKAPVKNGQLVEVVGNIVKHGNSSVTVFVELYAEDLLTGEQQLCAEGRFVLVAVDQNNRPVRLNPSLTCAR